MFGQFDGLEVRTWLFMRSALGCNLRLSFAAQNDLIYRMRVRAICKRSIIREPGESPQKYKNRDERRYTFHEHRPITLFVDIGTRLFAA